MQTSPEKKAKTIRLSLGVSKQLENVARVTNKSESSITEFALTEYFENHGYNTRYVMQANTNCYVLLKYCGDTFSIIDMQIRNGVPLEKVRESYGARFNSPVELLLVEEGATL